uniref:Cyclin-like domain-containing protein n=2 Tax=Ditylum brightwellii TaxID=49249 RepID=A0A7S4RL18_9STRA|mmetsp:Transcript_358/g.430  ORF Transcript_358/g.430 Transcript_358/m.430 type:complete len:324 (+) Transcript_358:112-1083(+)
MMDYDDIVIQLESMCRQEGTTYFAHDYLYEQPDQVVEGDNFGLQMPLHDRWFRSNRRSTTSLKRLDEGCRIKMSKWFYEVIDFCQFDRDTVCIAMSYLDRFLCTRAGIPALGNRKVFQLAAMSALYMAVKLFEKDFFEPEVIADLSRNSYTETDIVDMEMVILSALQWRVQPPTPLSFIRYFLALLPIKSEFDEEAKEMLLHLSRLHTEIAVNGYFFVTVKPSAIAVASILNSLDLMGESLMSFDLRNILMSEINKRSPLNPHEDEMKKIRAKLRRDYQKSYEIKIEKEEPHHSRPKTVSAKSKHVGAAWGNSPNSIVQGTTR